MDIAVSCHVYKQQVEEFSGSGNSHARYGQRRGSVNFVSARVFWVHRRKSRQEKLERAEPPIMDDTAENDDQVQELLRKIVQSHGKEASTELDSVVDNRNVSF